MLAVKLAIFAMLVWFVRATLLGAFASLREHESWHVDWRWLVQRMDRDLPLLHAALAVFNWMSPHRAATSASPIRERPLVTAGCRPRLIVAFRRGVSREPFESRSPSRFSPSPVRLPVRATYSFPLERRSRHRSEMAVF